MPSGTNEIATRESPVDFVFTMLIPQATAVCKTFPPEAEDISAYGGKPDCGYFWHFMQKYLTCKPPLSSYAPSTRTRKSGDKRERKRQPRH
jgi:hypothetical protein